MIINSSCVEANGADFDSLVCDPPYSDYVHKNATSNSPGKGVRHNDLGFSALNDDLRNTIASLAGGVKRWSVIYSDIEGLDAWRRACAAAGATYIRPIPWVRWSSPQLSGDRPPQGFELVTCYWGAQKGRKSWNGPGNLTHLKHLCLRGTNKQKAEKPLDQALDLVNYFSNPGDKILDPCAGSGTVGLACRLLGRDYVGYEIDTEWAIRAQLRLDTPTLSPRDQERYNRWLVTSEEETKDKARRKIINDKMRLKMAMSKVVVDLGHDVGEPVGGSLGFEDPFGNGTDHTTDSGGGCPVPPSAGGTGSNEGEAYSA